MSTKTIADPRILLRPDDDGRRTRIRRRVAVAVLGVAAVSGLALTVGANSTRTSPALGPGRSEPAISAWPAQILFGGCLADIECYGESQLITNNPPLQQPAVEDVAAWCTRAVDCPSMGVPKALGSEQNGRSFTPAD